MTLGFNFVRGQYQVFQNPETVQWAFFENAGGSYGHMGGMKTQSNIPSTILMNIIPLIVITIVIKKILGFLNRIKQYPISFSCNSILFSGDFYRCVSMILVTVLIIRV